MRDAMARNERETWAQTGRQMPGEFLRVEACSRSVHRLKK